MKKTLLLALTLQASGLALATDSAPANRDQNWYQADVIVFRHTNNTSDEVWPKVAPHPVPANAIELKSAKVSEPEPLSGNLLEAPRKVLTAPDLSRDAFIKLPSDDFELNQQAASLNRSNRYQVLSQTAWRMPVDDSRREIPVKIKASGGEQDHYLLEGSVTISSSRFLHVDADIWYSELAPEALSSKLTAKDTESQIKTGILADSEHRDGVLLHSDSMAAPVKITRNFHLNQRRRIRNTSEVQYMDSPVIGVLVKLTPYERPQSLLEIKEPEVMVK